MGLIGFVVVSTFSSSFPASKPLLVLSLLIYGGCALACYPVVLELVVETQFPAPEATASGLVFLVGQIVGAALLIIGDSLATTLSDKDKDENKCNGSVTATAGYYRGVDFGNRSFGVGADIGDSSEDAQASVPRDMTWANAFLCGVAALSAIVFMFFRADYVRTRAEEQNAAVKAENLYGLVDANANGTANANDANSNGGANAINANANSAANAIDANANIAANTIDANANGAVNVVDVDEKDSNGGVKLRSIKRIDSITIQADEKDAYRGEQRMVGCENKGFKR